MTQHPQYTITEKQVQTIEHLFSIPEHSMDDADYMMQKEVIETIRSRPAPAAPTFCDKVDGEYIVDEYTLDEIERLLNLPEHAWDESDYDAKATALKTIRSRPATAAPEGCPYWKIAGADFCRIANQMTKTQIATIRNQTLDDFLKEIKGDVDPALDYIDLDGIEAAYIRLRHQSTYSEATDR